MATWGYGPSDGPATWAKNFPDAGGVRQSPINIETSKVQFDEGLASNPLKINYNKESALRIENTGASVKCDCDAKSTLSGGPLGNQVYQLVQFHLHWGAQDSEGAEHQIDGQVYAAELHLVHWNTKYGSFGEAANKPDGLAVLCIFIKVGDAHPGFEAVSCQLGNVKGKGKKCETNDFDPATLLPGNTNEFWTYPGSLTTPPCYESVQFILFKETFEFSPEQMNALRSMKFGDEDCCDNMVNNYRPPCLLGSRKVMASFKQ